MSADNYFCVRRHDGKFVVTMHFMSDDGPLEPIRKNFDGSFVGGCTRAFDTWEEANEYANEEYAEYGVVDYTRIDEVANMRAQRDSYAAEAEALSVKLDRLEAEAVYVIEANGCERSTSGIGTCWQSYAYHAGDYVSSICDPCLFWGALYPADRDLLRGSHDPL